MIGAQKLLFIITVLTCMVLVCSASYDNSFRSLKRSKGKGGKKSKSNKSSKGGKKSKSDKSSKGGKKSKSGKSSKSSKSGKKCKFSGSQGALETFTFAVDLEAEGLCNDVTQEPDKSNLEQAICDFFNDSMDYQKCKNNAYVEVCSVADFNEASTCSRRNNRRRLLPSQASMHISGRARPPSRAPDLPGFSSLNIGWRKLGRHNAPILLDYINVYFPGVTGASFTDIEEIDTCQSENRCEYDECNCETSTAPTSYSYSYFYDRH